MSPREKLQARRPTIPLVDHADRATDAEQSAASAVAVSQADSTGRGPAADGTELRTDVRDEPTDIEGPRMCRSRTVPIDYTSGSSRLCRYP